MNYKMIYDMLIEKGKSRTKIDGYFERHHIIPRCCGGTNDDDNLVNLTAKEHYVAHHLLVKIYEHSKFYSKLICAFRYMTVGHAGKRLSTAYDYDYMRKLFSENHPCKDPECKLEISESLKQYYEKTDDARSKLAEQARSYWQNLSDEEKNARNAAISQHWQNLSEAEKNERINKTKQGLLTFYKNLADAERDEVFKNLRITTKTAEFREHQREAALAFWNSLSDAERQLHIDKLQKGHTDISRQKQSASLKKFLSSLTAEELSARAKHSFGNCDQKKRGEAISKAKKGKKTKQNEIMGNRFADMSDEEFSKYLSSKSHYVWKKYTNLRLKVLHDRTKNANS